MTLINLLLFSLQNQYSDDISIFILLFFENTTGSEHHLSP